MKPTAFPEANRVLTRPAGTTPEECGDLHVLVLDEHCISRWEPTAEERVAIAAGAPVWLSVWSGGSQPPVLVTVEQPFKILGWAGNGPRIAEAS